jgi:hypothetical protein
VLEERIYVVKNIEAPYVVKNIELVKNIEPHS